MGSILPFELTTEYTVGVAIGTLAVIVFCFASFNKPAEEFAASEHESLFLPRDQTGHIQYLLGFVLYLAVFVTVYLLLCAIGPDIGYSLLLLIPALKESGIGKEVVAGNVPIYIALLLIGVIPSYEKLNFFERSFRRAVHRRASIPTALRSLVRQLQEDEVVHPSPVQVPSEYLLAATAPGQDDQPSVYPEFRELWNRLAFLFYRYRNRGSDLRAYFSDDFISRHAHVSEQINRDFGNLYRVIQERDKRLVDISDTSPDSELYTRARDLYNKLCYFVAGSIIQKCGLSTKRYQALQRIGYKEESTPSGSSVVVLAVGFIMLWVTASVMIFAADEKPFKASIASLIGSWPSSTDTFLNIVPFMLRQFIVILFVFGMYHKKIHTSGLEGDTPKEFGSSLAVGLPVCLGGATLAQLIYYVWVTGVQFTSLEVVKYTTLLPYWVESLVSGITLWILLYIMYSSPAKRRMLAFLQVAFFGMMYGLVCAGLGYFATRLRGDLWMHLVNPDAPKDGAGFYTLMVFVFGSLIGITALATAYIEWGLARVRSSFVYGG